MACKFLCLRPLHMPTIAIDLNMHMPIYKATYVYIIKLTNTNPYTYTRTSITKRSIVGRKILPVTKMSSEFKTLA